MKNEFWAKPWLVVGEGDGDGGGAGAGGDGAGGTGGAGDGDGAGGTGTAGGSGSEKTFTQADVDRLISERVNREKKSQEKTLAQLKSLQETAKMTKEERDKLNARVEELETANMTREELATRERKKEQEAFEKQLAAATDEAKTWQGRFTQSTIDRAITDAAVAADAYSPQQLVSLLRLNTTLEEGKGEDGAPNGNFMPKVAFQTVNEEKEPVTLSLTVDEAIKQMKEMPEQFGNLFKSGVTAGAGGGTAGGTATDPSAEDLKDPAKYMAARKKKSLAELTG